jgi:hypothetical protein
VSTYEELIAAADHDYAQGRYKKAHVTYGQAVSEGSARNHYCRQMRGICSRLVAEERMQLAVVHPDQRQEFLNQAARWLAKAEANLDSAFDESPELQLGHIRLEQARTEDAIVRFMEMSGGNPARRISAARTFREEAYERLADA